MDKELKEFLEFMINETTKRKKEDPPISLVCQVELSKPITSDLCYDFREIRRWVMCNTWKLIEREHLSFSEAIKRSWREIKLKCLAKGYRV